MTFGGLWPQLRIKKGRLLNGVILLLLNNCTFSMYLFTGFVGRLV